MHITSGVLMECSFVKIPANPDASVLSARHFNGSSELTDHEILMLKARTRTQIILAKAALALSEPEPIGDHKTFIARHGAKAYTDAILKGRR